jgi:hypothetical protein
MRSLNKKQLLQQMEPWYTMEKKNKLRYQLYVGIIVAIVGIIFMLMSFLYAFGYSTPLAPSPLLWLLLLAIGFWLCYKAEKDLKKI